MDAWLSAARDTIARAAGVPATELALERDDVRALLDLAHIAAHESGQRTNAPLVCYLVGRAVERGEADLATLAGVVGGAAE